MAADSSLFRAVAGVTARIAEAAHAVGAGVGGELGILGSLETGQAASEGRSGAEGKLTTVSF